MSRPSCDDCGTRLDGGICPNCCEELFIFETQLQEIDDPTFTISPEFAQQVEEQRRLTDEKTEAGDYR